MDNGSVPGRNRHKRREHQMSRDDVQHKRQAPEKDTIISLASPSYATKPLASERKAWKDWAWTLG